MAVPSFPEAHPSTKIEESAVPARGHRGRDGARAEVGRGREKIRLFSVSLVNFGNK